MAKTIISVMKRMNWDTAVSSVAYLFCITRRLEKKMSYFTLSNGEKLYYEDIGNGAETLVMMHGWTSSHVIYEKPAEQLKEKARCIIYDHRGHRGSRDANRERPTMETLAGDLDELIRGLSLSKVTLLGWSMGAGVAMNYVKLFGCGALRQVILCDMTPKQQNDADWKLGLYQGAYTRRDMEQDAGKDFLSLYRSFAVGAIPKLRKVPAVLLNRGLKKWLKDCDEEVLKSLSASMKEQDLREAVGQITVPLTYFYADPGSLFSPKLADWYLEHAVSSFQSVRFPNATHMLVSDYPELFATEVGKLL